jgi:hypothetical protein
MYGVAAPERQGDTGSQISNVDEEVEISEWGEIDGGSTGTTLGPSTLKLNENDVLNSF